MSTQTIADLEFAAIDFESAGAAPGTTDEPVQVGWAILAEGRIARENCFRSYLRAEKKVAWRARKVHGIADKDLEGAPRLLELWPKVRADLSGRILVAHGAGTERRFLRVFPMHGLGPWLDSLKLARSLVPGQKSYALGDLCAVLGVAGEVGEACPDGIWHEALFDAVASLVLVRRLFEMSGLSSHPAGGIDEWLDSRRCRTAH